jgi:hypothetical protein
MEGPVNVWIIVFTNVNTERILGPFTSLIVDEDAIVDGLTGNTIIYRNDTGWLLNIPDLVIYGRRIVIQSGGFESPWGERGKPAKIRHSR